MAWNDSDCRMFAVSGVQVPVSQPAADTETKNDPVLKIEGGEKKEKESLVARVTVTEVETTKNGNIRATCQVENGCEKQVVIAKNGAGKALQSGKSKRFEISYNVMKDGIAWYAIKVKELQL